MMQLGQLLVSMLGTLALATSACRKVDSQSSNTLATKPSELFSTNAEKRCLDRASQLSISKAQQAALCKSASSSAPVDCFKKKSPQNSAVAQAISECQGAR